MDRQVDRQDRQVDRFYIGRKIDLQIYGQIDIYRQMDRQIYRWMDKWMDGCMDE